MPNPKICVAEGCDKPVPEARRFDAIYCSNRCQMREWQRRYRARRRERELGATPKVAPIATG